MSQVHTLGFTRKGLTFKPPILHPRATASLCNIPSPEAQHQDPRRRRCSRLNVPPNLPNYFRCSSLKRGCERQRKKALDTPHLHPGLTQAMAGRNQRPFLLHGVSKLFPPAHSTSSRAGSTDHCLPLASGPEPPAFVPAPNKTPDEFFQLSVREESGSVL